MQITPLGFIVISLAIFFAVRKPLFLFPLSIISSVFVGAAVINFDFSAYPIGLQPFYFVNVVIFFRYILVKTHQKGFFDRKSKYLNLFFKYLFAFIFFCTISVLFSIVFSGMPVLGSRTGIDEIEAGNFELLKLSFSTFAILIYLISNFFYLHFLIRVIEKAKNSLERNKIVNLLFNSYIYSGLLVIFFGILQKVCSITGLPFPKDLIYSSLTYTQGGSLTFQNIARISSTFLEPSSAGCFLSAFSIFLLCFLIRKQDKLYLLYFCLSCLTLFFTTSTTGYISFLMIIFALVFFGFIEILFSKKARRGLFLKIAILIIMSLLIFIAFNASAEVQSIFSEFIFNKGSSSSFVNRSASNEYSIQLLFNTFGLGVGLAGHRPSGLLFLIISNLGIIGFLLFLVVFVLIPLKFIRSLSFYKAHFLSAKSIDFSVLIFQSFWGYSAFLLSMIIANPTLQDASLWISLSLLLSGYACVSLNQADTISSDENQLVNL
jgi:hypothetical protein